MTDFASTAKTTQPQGACFWFWQSVLIQGRMPSISVSLKSGGNPHLFVRHHLDQLGYKELQQLNAVLKVGNQTGIHLRGGLSSGGGGGQVGRKRVGVAKVQKIGGWRGSRCRVAQNVVKPTGATNREVCRG